MTIAATGVVAGDFTQILTDLTRTLSYKVVTITQNARTGDETTAFATASNVSAVFFLNDQKYLFDKDGLLAVGDAYIMAATTVGIKRYDQFTVDSKTYYVETVVRRHVAGVAMADYASCMLVTP